MRLPRIPRISVLAPGIFVGLGVAIAVVTLGVAIGHADEPVVAAVKPGLNDSFVDPDIDIDSWVQRFEVESREIFQARHQIIENMHLEPGSRVADIGAGTGLFVPMLATAVGQDGWVYAVDIAPRFIQHIAKSIEDQSLSRITPVICSPVSVSLPPDSLDAAFICDVYHHFEFPAKTLATLHQSLKAEGRVFLIDFERVPGVSREWVLDHVRAGKQTAIDEMRQAGFELVAERAIPLLTENYYLEFRRRAATDH